MEKSKLQKAKDIDNVKKWVDRILRNLSDPNFPYVISLKAFVKGKDEIYATLYMNPDTGNPYEAKAREAIINTLKVLKIELDQEFEKA